MGLLAACAALLLLLTSGCGGDGKVPVSGSVSFDGQPVERGEISFVPVEAGQSPDGGTIENGQFAFRTTPGAKRVEIRASRPLPPEKQTDAAGTFYEDFIPARYNRESSLQQEVPAEGASGLKFDLVP